MNPRLARVLFACVVIAAPAACTQTPRHVEFGRRLLAQARPQDLSYQHRPTVVVFEDDDEGPARVHADCSGLVSDILDRAYPDSAASLHAYLKAERPLVRHYYDAIQNERGFLNITRIAEVRPGDLIAAQYATKTGDTGHIMIVDSLPASVSASWTPSGFKHFTLRVLDSTSSFHGQPDTRLGPDGKPLHAGLGTGVISLLARDGLICGYAWGTSERSTIYFLDQRPMVVGRYLPEKKNRRE
jgi:hypothetical protein